MNGGASVGFKPDEWFSHLIGRARSRRIKRLEGGVRLMTKWVAVHHAKDNSAPTRFIPASCCRPRIAKAPPV